MKTDHIKEFLYLAETLNFSTASKAFYITQPTLSRHIQEMEKELGFSLFNTSSHGVELTREGKDAKKVFSKMMKEYEGMQARWTDWHRQIEGHIRLGLLYYSLSDYFTDFLPFINEKNPGVSVKCLNYRPQELLDDLLAGKIDIGQISYVDEKNPKLYYQKIAMTDMIVVMSNKNPLARCTELKLSDLEQETLAELKNDRYSTNITREMFNKCGVSFKNIIETDNIETVPHTCKTYNAIHVTGSSCRKQQAAGVSYIPITDAQAHSWMALACLKSNNNLAVRKFLDDAKLFFERNR
ncbi:MAG: LysR family transcriptional regulator [Lachnospiraceae bacterium]|nr:LysR family transcriptional regulator [Lachnospiraceae bacterium]